MNITDIIKSSLEESVSVNAEASIDKDLISALSKASNLLIETFSNKGKILLAGNGGSAADCQHIAAEFIGRLNFDRSPLPAIALTTNTSNLTCIANDYGYEEIFTRQMHALANENDSLIVYSTSGKSKNIIKLVVEAKNKVKNIIALTGNYTEELSKHADVVISVKASKLQEYKKFMLLLGILCVNALKKRCLILK